MVHMGAVMKPSTQSETTIGVTAFKSQCLGLIDAVAQGKTDRIILLKHNKPVAAIVPIPKDDDPFELWGAMRGTVTFLPDVDLTEPTGEIWDAEQ
jgi:antitoxin (DNA-binding transcriptional repressor) of toxin-antitoxin stability system